MSRRKREAIEQAAVAAAVKADENKSPRLMRVFRKRWPKITALVFCLLLVTVVSGAVLSGWQPLSRSGFASSRAVTGAATSSALIAAQTSATPQLSKENIYAGSRLLAVEEAGGGTSGVAPAAPIALLATAATGSSSSVTINWTAAASSPVAVARYEIERSTSLAGAFTTVSNNTTATSFTDASVAAGTAYIYRVRAVGTNNVPSIYSNADLAVAIAFVDDPFIANTTVKAQHITQLRQAVDAVRALAGVGAATWTAGAAAGSAIRAVHIEELRTNLNQALTALGLPTGSYTDASLIGVYVKRAHLEELRQRLK